MSALCMYEYGRAVVVVVALGRAREGQRQTIDQLFQLHLQWTTPHLLHHRRRTLLAPTAARLPTATLGLELILEPENEL